MIKLRTSRMSLKRFGHSSNIPCKHQSARQNQPANGFHKKVGDDGLTDGKMPIAESLRSTPLGAPKSDGDANRIRIQNFPCRIWGRCPTLAPHCVRCSAGEDRGASPVSLAQNTLLK